MFLYLLLNYYIYLQSCEYAAHFKQQTWYFCCSDYDGLDD